MIYFIFRFLAVPLLLVGYILYQLIVQKKTMTSMTTDMLYAVLFIAVYTGLYLFFTSWRITYQITHPKHQLFDAISPKAKRGGFIDFFFYRLFNWDLPFLIASPF
jgi:hypothetical protein